MGALKCQNSIEHGEATSLLSDAVYNPNLFGEILNVQWKGLGILIFFECTPFYCPCCVSPHLSSFQLAEDLLNGDLEPELKLPEQNVPNGSHLVRLTRTTKLGHMLLPILTSYRSANKKIASLKKKIPDEREFDIARKKLLDAQHAKEAPAMKHILVEMGGLYNKGAQLLASQQLIMPAALVEELKSCFEDMPHRKWSKMEHAIYLCLGNDSVDKGKKRVNAEFETIDQKPLAAASIGQVHTGILKSGERVVVKVLYPEIRKNMAADLATMKTSISLIVAMLEMNDMKNMIDTFYDEVAANFPMELDFHVELAHMDYARKLLARHSPNIVVPKSYPKLSGTSVLTQELVIGDTLNKIGHDKNPARLAAGRKALDEVIDCFGEMIFRDGFFHADPHPGNIMVLEDGRASIIDWGQCMQLTRAQRRRMCQMVIMLRTRCIDLVVTGLNASGFEFPKDNMSTTAAIIFFFFDSAIESPFSADIDEFGETLRSSPSQMALPTDMPSEVIFFARVMQCFRRDCEVLETDISAIDRWMPIARRELQNIVYNDPIPRNPKAAPNSTEFEDDEDDTSQWSPSRMVLMLDTSRFKPLEKGIKWAQAHPKVGDACLTWALAAQETNASVITGLLQRAVDREHDVANAIRAILKNAHAIMLLLLVWSILGLLGLISLISWLF
jgi:predicted unusual protein kinase regulating ubiquinone biosynthesis (AarF/ABC1/UbiB family)